MEKETTSWYSRADRIGVNTQMYYKLRLNATEEGEGVGMKYGEENDGLVLSFPSFAANRR